MGLADGVVVLGAGGRRSGAVAVALRAAVARRSCGRARRLAAGGGGLRRAAAGPGARPPLRRASGPTSWLALPIAAWVGASPWIWGYDDVDGAIATDVVTGARRSLLALAGDRLPGAAGRSNVLAGLWLVDRPGSSATATTAGRSGLSDTHRRRAADARSRAARALTAAERRAAARRPAGIGRLPPLAIAG